MKTELITFNFLTIVKSYGVLSLLNSLLAPFAFFAVRLSDYSKLIIARAGASKHMIFHFIEDPNSFDAPYYG